MVLAPRHRLSLHVVQTGKELESRCFQQAAEKADATPNVLGDLIAPLRAIVEVPDSRAEDLVNFISMASSKNSECPDSIIGKSCVTHILLFAWFYFM